ncbi:MAG: hypothetical protein JXB60_03445 [Candidatus Cloacimonetes bacterium]|nr:hypothetical protein [Candidatus Cloacimonadota bacterium]
MNIRKYNPVLDREAVHRIWKESGWLEDGKEETMDIFIRGCETWVGEIAGAVEFLVMTAPGNMRYLQVDIPFSGVMSVNTGRVSRQLGLARKFTAQAIARAAEKGAWISGLGIFEQGFYNQLGYGSGGYEHVIYFDPADLKIQKKCRIPRRLTEKDFAEIHYSRLQRLKNHGSVSFFNNQISLAEIKWGKKGFGIGYYDDTGSEITHHVWMEEQGGEHGPYFVNWMSYRNYEQFLELMSYLKSLEDQVRLIGIIEPAQIQLNDLLQYPFRYRIITGKSRFENRIKASSWWQMRICDLEKVIHNTSLPGKRLQFNLILTDPISHYLGNTGKWCGIGGNYLLSLGRKSFLKRATSADLPTLHASVNAFTRMWLGVRPASGLAVTDDLKGPADLLAELDNLFCIPEPHQDWEY